MEAPVRRRTRPGMDPVCSRAPLVSLTCQPWFTCLTAADTIWAYRHASIFIYYCMALSIKDPEADRLAREVAKATGESLTTAVVQSLRERLARVRRMRGPRLGEERSEERRVGKECRCGWGTEQWREQREEVA